MIRNSKPPSANGATSPDATLYADPQQLDAQDDCQVGHWFVRIPSDTQAGSISDYSPSLLILDVWALGGSGCQRGNRKILFSGLHGISLMAQTLSVAEVVRHFGEYINRVSYRGEYFVLVRGNKPVAELRPIPPGKRLSELPALLASLPHLSPAEATRFGDDLAAARQTLIRAAVNNPPRS